MVSHGSRKRWKEDRHWGLGDDGKGIWSPKAFRWDSDATDALEIYAKEWAAGARPFTMRIYFSGVATINVSVRDEDGEIGGHATYVSGTPIALIFGAKDISKLVISGTGAFNVTHIDTVSTTTTTTSTTTTTTGS